MRAGTSLRTPALWLAALALVAFAGSAQAQVGPSCTITGPETSSGPVELCGPEGNYEYYWARPEGGIAFTRCITAYESGQYVLWLTDLTTKVQGEPCFHKLEIGGEPPKCDIDGPDSFCEGDKAELCGPEGDHTYHWTGPDDFEAFTRCIDVTVPGEYTLVVDGGTKDECSAKHEITDEKCETNCPRTIGFWTQQCLQRDNGATKFTAGQVTSIAACIDGKSAFFSWGDDFAGFCAAINPATTNQRTQAKRQYAAMLANICTGELGLIANNGNEISLDPDTEITCDGDEMTIAELITWIEGQLASLEGQDLSDNSVKNAYAKIVACTDNINNGVGIGPLCDELEKALRAGDGGTLAFSDADVALDMGAIRAFPNPFKGMTTLAYAVAPQGEAVSLGVYDIAGRQVKPLFNGFQVGGVHRTAWDGTDVSGARARSGMYFIRGKVGERVVSSRVLMVE